MRAKLTQDLFNVIGLKEPKKQQTKVKDESAEGTQVLV